MTKKWEKYKPHILQLYKEQNKPLKEVKVIMQREYGFTAS